jgi:hypothetical protein
LEIGDIYDIHRHRSHQFPPQRNFRLHLHLHLHLPGCEEFEEESRIIRGNLSIPPQSNIKLDALGNEFDRISLFET